MAVRKAFIAFGFASFLVYCWVSVAYQNRVPIPDYRLVEVDLLGGKSRAAWDAEPQIQFQRLMELEKANYQLPEDSAIRPEGAAGVRVGSDGRIAVDRPLTSDDFAWFIDSAPAGRGVRMRLRDTSAIYGLLAHKYLLRDNIEVPERENDRPLYIGGRPLDKEMLDDLRGRGFASITVTGHGAPVTFLTGTAVMVAIIFLTLAAALKPVVWDPFLALLEKRRRELEIGAEAERQNQLEAARFNEERRRRNDDLYREIQAVRLREQRETAQAAATIVKEAREKEKAVKVTGLREIAVASKRAEAELEESLPEMAEAVADALTPVRGGPRWDILGDKGER
jgi:F0F1-type ATP synthase membrane subunit b/b'